MKAYIRTLLPFLAILMATLPSCRRASDNGLLDGLWRIDHIDYFPADGPESTADPSGFLIAIQLELLQLDNQNPVATAIMSYSKDERTIGLRFPENPEPELLRKFGIMDNPCVLKIVSLSSSSLVLESPSSRIKCTRF